MTTAAADEIRRFTAVVVGSGFAGAVTACRLAQAGIDVCVLERGRRYETADFPTVPLGRRRSDAPDDSEPGDYDPPRDFSRWLWPIDRGLWDVRDLGEVVSVQAAGFGGGSLIYANVHLRAPLEVLEDWPTAYRGAALDPYYDLAAHMLGVTPADGNPHTLAKTERLREASAPGDWFRVPLAVNFGSPGVNAWGKQQGSCDLRGFCCLGCGRQAKNTLDLNYLALAERPNTAEGKPATVITLAEVRKIKRAGKTGPYTLTYRDHLLQQDVELSAEHVFLCAGALGTTELLLANFAWAFPGDAPPRTPYFANGDSLAVVFDGANAQEADRGPTITSAARHSKDGLWFLVQDGGVPEELEAVLGVFRSPLFLYRNRYLEVDPRRESVDAHDSTVSARRTARLLDIAATHFRRYQQSRSQSARALLAMLPPRSLERVRGDKGIAWPRWLSRALRDRRELLFDQVSVVAEPLAQRTLDHLADLLEPRIREIEQIFPAARGLLKDTADLGIARGLLSLGAQILWGSEADVVRNTLRFLVRTPRNLDEIVRTLMPLVRWAADYKPRDGRTGVLLTMGRDDARLLQRTSDGELQASSASGSPRRLRQIQELALRDIARSWGGELRTNPTWALGHRQLTVHGQGGAPMGPTRAVAVTDTWGEVFDCPGLFVMDAAAFPSAVGVNPSATIAAVAEKKVEYFIRAYKKDRTWSAPERAKAAPFPDPLRALELTNEMRVSTPTSPRGWQPFGVVGILFNERMDGYYSTSDVEQKQSLRAQRLAIDANDVEISQLEDWVRGVEHAEVVGLRAGFEPPAAGKKRVTARMHLPPSGSIALNLRAKVADLTTFLEDYPGHPTPIELRGTIAINERKTCIKAGTLTLFPPTGSKRRRLIEYEIEFRYGQADCILYAFKLIEDDPRLDVWQDTATLFMALESPRKTEVRRGVLRVSAKAFLKRQLKSLRVVGTTDDERRMWALAAFVSFFAGNLAASYLPELKRVPAVLKNMLKRTHG